ncbi:hypothetical protein Pmani_005022 [Petrolisthes manimaculis]|uniref:Uncharacterized protein n=1 Tax=Petrolisthes manimaculis TaxID=1843537 RepID=A0AAE1UH14_9EUCA|nr:hypothetical protein Pmani_005022 [Petrolisthes manimaculis]
MVYNRPLYSECEGGGGGGGGGWYVKEEEEEEEEEGGGTVRERLSNIICELWSTYSCHNYQLTTKQGQTC